MEFLIEILIEFVLELLFEGGKEIYSDKRISKWIRYPIAFLIILIIVVVILGILFLGIYFLKDNTLIGLFFIVIAIVMLIGGLIKVKKVYTQSERNY